MKRFAFLLLVLAVTLTACTARTTPTPITAEPTNPPTVDPSITIVDALDRTVVLPAAPTRIVLTGKALFMIADAAYLFPEASTRIVGLGNSGQGSSNFISLIDPAFADKVLLESDAGAEQIAALQPDLVILKSYLAETVGAPIEAIGIPVVYVDFETPEQYTRDLAVFGQVFQDEARAQELIAYYQSAVGLVQQTLPADVARPRTLLLYYSDKDGVVSFNVPPVSWIQTRMVEMAGGDPVWGEASLGQGWTQVTLEQIAAWDADQVFIVSYNRSSSEVVAELLADPNWQALRAVQEHQIYAFAGDLYSWDQPDTRWVLGMQWLAGRLHPEAFAGQDMVIVAESFYQELYGLDAEFFVHNILPAFKGDLP
jgi:iron complex transport system substrate-binding protein